MFVDRITSLEQAKLAEMAGYQAELASVTAEQRVLQHS
jgi:hypothetical protein